MRDGTPPSEQADFFENRSFKLIVKPNPLDRLNRPPKLSI